MDEKPKRGRGRPATWPPNVYRHPNGRDRIRVRGVDYWLGPTGSQQAKDEYARLVAELAAGAAEPARRPAGWLTLAEVAERFAKERLPSCSEKERGHYRHALAALLAGGRAKLRADQLKAGTLASVRAEMLLRPWRRRAPGREGRAVVGWSPAHANRQVTRLRTMWRWAEEHGLAPEGSWAHLRTLRALPPHHPGRAPARTRPAGAEELEALLPRVRSGAVRAMLTLQHLTGMRSGELRGMRAGEVDASAEVWVYRPARHKNSWRGQSREVPLGPRARAVLGPWLKGKAAGARVFLTRDGKPYTANAYGLTVSRAAAKVNLPWVRPGCFRHGAKQRITREMGLDHARSMLGQKHLGTTNLYGDAVDLTMATGVARRLG